VPTCGVEINFAPYDSSLLSAQGSGTTHLDTAAPAEVFHRPVAHTIYERGVDSQSASCALIVLLLPLYRVTYNCALDYSNNEEFVSESFSRKDDNHASTLRDGESQLPFECHTRIRMGEPSLT
jgi:hypothetical protein